MSPAKSNNVSNATAAGAAGVQPGTYCKYVDGTFTKLVKLGESMPRQTLNSRCVLCWKCQDFGMQCQRTASG